MVRRKSTKIMHEKLKEELTLKVREEHQKIRREILPRTNTPEIHSEIDMQDPMIQEIILSQSDEPPLDTENAPIIHKRNNSFKVDNQITKRNEGKT